MHTVLQTEPANLNAQPGSKSKGILTNPYVLAYENHVHLSQRSQIRRVAQTLRKPRVGNTKYGLGESMKTLVRPLINARKTICIDELQANPSRPKNEVFNNPKMLDSLAARSA